MHVKLPDMVAAKAKILAQREAPPPPPLTASDKALTQIASVLHKIAAYLERPAPVAAAPIVHVAAPKVDVRPPNITIQAAPARAWKFKHTYDRHGDLIESDAFPQ